MSKYANGITAKALNTREPWFARATEKSGDITGISGTATVVSNSSVSSLNILILFSGAVVVQTTTDSLRLDVSIKSTTLVVLYHFIDMIRSVFYNLSGPYTGPPREIHKWQ